MTTFVQVGQCGNQLGEAFWRLTADVCPRESNAGEGKMLRKKSGKPAAPQSAVPALYAEQLYHVNSHRARCIIVDTEPKVIRAVTRATVSDGWKFEPAHAHFEQSGRGNNWAMGYNLQTHQRNVLRSKSSDVASVATSNDRGKRRIHTTSLGDSDGHKRELVELVMESLRQEIEELDVYRGTVLMHSLGGGTGAGLGCRLLETIRDTYPRSYLAAVSVAPSCSSGDTPLQNYNSVFTLQHLQEHTDCIVYKENDELLRAAMYWKGVVASTTSSSGASPREEQTRITLKEMNALAASDIAGLIFPTVTSHRAAPAMAVPFDLARLVHDCCPLPTDKFLDVRTGVCRVAKIHPHTAVAFDPIFHAVPRTTTSSGLDDDTNAMSKLTKLTLQSFPRWTPSSRAIGAQAIFRSKTNTAVGQLQDALTAGLPRFHLGNGIEVQSSSYPPFSSFGGKASVTVALNHGHALDSVRHFLDRGRRQFAANAYTHWYKQYGLEDGDFELAFEHATQIVRHYEELLRP